MTVEETARALRAGTVTSRELVEESLAAADRQSWLGVFSTRFDDDALAAAECADRELAAGRDRGPLHGVPVGVKDMIGTREGPTAGGTLVPGAGLPAGRDAAVVTRLRDAGAVVVGKTATTELGCGVANGTPPARNPWHPDRWPGGSSTGTATGVAAGLFPAGLGSDSAGSIRMPAAFCGVTGLMPTYGLVPKDGCIPLGPSVGRVGPIGRTAGDCAALLRVIAGRPADPAPPVLDGLRIGVVRSAPAGSAAGRAFDDALLVLSGGGARLRDVVLPHEAEVVTSVLVSVSCEAHAFHRRRLAEHWPDWQLPTRWLMADGALVSGADYVQAQHVRRLARDAVAGLFDDLDLIVGPTTSIGAPPFDEITDPDGQMGGALLGALHTPYWNGVGNPVLAVPAGLDDDGFPLSLQIAGPWHGDDAVLRAGAAFQASTGWHERRPTGAPA